MALELSSSWLVDSCSPPIMLKGEERREWVRESVARLPETLRQTLILAYHQDLKYREIAEDSSLPQPYRDAALLRQTSIEFDSLQPQQVIARLQPLAKPGTPWFGTAGEMTALALIKQGQSGQAAQLFAAIAKDKTVPDPIRARAVQIASSLGVDASAALPPAQ